MNFMSRAVRLCGAVVTAAVFFAGLTTAPVRASDDLPIVGDIPMPEVHVNVRVGDDDMLPPPRRFVYPRGPFAAIPPARFEPSAMDSPAVAPQEVARMLRSTGYSLLGQINRRGWVYTAAVLNPRGDDGRAVIDARTGAIIRFIPALAVNARLNDELGVIYGSPGPPPVVQDFSRAPRPPKPVPRVTKRDAAPKLADRMPASAQPASHPATTSSIPSKSEPAKSEAAKSSPPPVQQTASTQARPVESPAEAKPTPALQPDAKPSVELLPTKQMPDVQPLD